MVLISSIVGGLLVGALTSFLVLMLSLIPGLGGLSHAALPIFYAATLLSGMIIVAKTTHP
ncbi:MAG: hypothetical protein OXL37_13030 [Chloroflexota bacterium]|nr:hypothetical protein [Chloroflexota bacterium]MDE2959180.1 hypothetical protein [Chloroflexota bacterium]